MKRLLLVLLFLMALTATKAQDRIITVQKDTIVCQIISVGDERIVYEQRTSDNQIVGKSIAAADVFQYFRVNRTDEGHGAYATPVRRPRTGRLNLFTIQGGLARLSMNLGAYKNMLTGVGLLASEADAYIGKITNGFHVNAGFHYLLPVNIGLGVDYVFFYSASEGVFLLHGNNPMNLPLYVNLSLNEKIYSHFAGPSLLFQQFPGSKGKIKISETFSSGIVLFRNEVRNNSYGYYLTENTYYETGPPQYYDKANSVTTGTTFGIKGGASVEYIISPEFSAGLAGNFIWAKLKKVSFKDAQNEINDQELETAIDVSSLNYGLTLRYSF